MTAPSAIKASNGSRATREGCALVTGGSRGIGAATAQALAADGWPVALVYRSSEAAAREVARVIESGGGTVALVPADVTDHGVSERIFDAAAELGPVLVLVNNAGVRADGLDVLDVLRGDLDLVLVLDHLRELDQIERIHIELFEGCIPPQRRRVGTELLQSAEDRLLDLVRGGNRGCHVCPFVQADMPPSTTSVCPVM